MTTTLTPERIEELLSCPFCGSDAFIIGPVDGLYRAQCKSCGTSVGEFKTRKECAPFWNCRALSRDGMREALVKLVNTKALSGVRELVAGWNGEGKPDGPYGKHPPKLGAHIPTNCGAIYELDEAMTAARAALSPDAPRQKVEG